MGMEYIYAALMLHEAGKKIEEDLLTQVLKAAGIEPDPAKVKQLVSSLSGVNIDEIISQATTMPVAAAPAAAPAAEEKAAEEKKEEEEEEKKKEEEEEEAALAGLGALFG